jgi:hypothetical protein
LYSKSEESSHVSVVKKNEERIQMRYALQYCLRPCRPTGTSPTSPKLPTWVRITSVVAFLLVLLSVVGNLGSVGFIIPSLAI